MRVTSPVGEYEYRVKSVKLDGGRIVVAGSLGVWETTMVVEPSDLLALGRTAAGPAALLGSLALVASLRRWRRRRV